MIIGERIGHYRVESQLGSGGMGVLYVAEDLSLGRKVVLKFLSEDVPRDPSKHLWMTERRREWVNCMESLRGSHRTGSPWRLSAPRGPAYLSCYAAFHCVIRGVN